MSLHPVELDWCRWVQPVTACLLRRWYYQDEEGAEQTGQGARDGSRCHNSGIEVAGDARHGHKSRRHDFILSSSLGAGENGN